MQESRWYLVVKGKNHEIKKVKQDIFLFDLF